MYFYGNSENWSIFSSFYSYLMGYPYYVVIYNYYSVCKLVVIISYYRL